MGTTPIYGIRYPDPSTRANQLPQSFQNIAVDVEAALQAASIPPVTPAPVMVAATAAARDAFWGVPATPAEQTTLQNRGASTIRTDKGWTERYFAAGAGVVAVAGWYPVDGNLPVLSVITSTSQAIGTASTVITFGGTMAQPLLARNVTFVPATGLATMQVAGRYRFGGQLVQNAATSGSRALTIRRNGTAVLSNLQSTGAVLQLNVEGEAVFAAGDTLDMISVSSGGATTTVLGGAGYWTALRADYMGPA